MAAPPSTTAPSKGPAAQQSVRLLAVHRQHVDVWQTGTCDHAHVQHQVNQLWKFKRIFVSTTIIMFITIVVIVVSPLSMHGLMLSVTLHVASEQD